MIGTARSGASDEARLAAFFSRPMEDVIADPGHEEALAAALDALERGEVRAAIRGESTETETENENEDRPWRAVPWVKTAILSGFRSSSTVEMPGGAAPACDRAAFPARRFGPGDGIRLVPGGSAVRRGAHVAPGVVVMPPSYVNVGAFVGRGTMIDSHVLVGSCAQIGADVHLAAGAQIGGVLEPPGALPVIVEDGVFIGAQCGVFEGVRVSRRAVLAPGVQLTASTVLFDLVTESTRRGTVPPGAVVVPGARSASGPFAELHGLATYAPIVVKYRDDSTDAATALEEALRDPV